MNLGVILMKSRPQICACLQQFLIYVHQIISQGKISTSGCAILRSQNIALFEAAQF
jgi:hypothetical protein